MKKLFFFLLIATVFEQPESLAQTAVIPYHLNPLREAICGGSGMAISLAPFLIKPPQKFLDIWEVSQLNTHDVNFMDRGVTNNRSLPLRATSRTLPVVSGLAGLATLVISPVFISSGNQRLKDAATLGLIYLEGVLWSQGLAFGANTWINRPKPFVYNNNLPMEQRVFQNNNASFFSKRSCFTFYNAGFFCLAVKDIFNDKRLTLYSSLIFGSLALGTTVTEIAAGEHFTTDVITGAAVGLVSAYFTLWVHRDKAKQNAFEIYPVSNGYYQGISLIYKPIVQ